jgi:DNA-binding beta-propeller fold protein YncE
LVIAIGLVLLGAMAFLFFRAENASKPDRVWGQRGVMPGEVARPRAAALDPRTGHLFLVDFTARIQCYDLDGQHLGVTWTTPDFRNGRPSGLGIDQSGNLLVADSHYHCVRVYDHQGRELRVLGGTAGSEPGQFGYVSDCVQDVEGNYFISEFGANDRITKLDPSGNFLRVIGKAGQGPGEFSRIRALAIGPEGMLYVVDACNHRIQVLTRDGEYVREFGSPGPEPGQLHYPYDLAFHPDGLLYVVERGNHRVQKFDPKTGQSLGTWGRGGRSPGQLADPWALVIDPFGRVHIVDTENHRVQRIKF